MRILVIDDEVHIRKTTTVTLDALGHECVQASNATEVIGALNKGSFDAAFLDLRLGDEKGLELIPKMLSLEPKLNIIVFTAYSSVESAVEAMRRGAVDYIAKPFTPEQIRQSLSRIENNRRLENRVVELESMLSSNETLADFNTDEPMVQKLFETATKAASSAATILLLGESGTGKSVLARALHRNSPFRDNAFVTVACPSLSRELLESELFGHVRGAFTGAVGETWGKVKAAEVVPSFSMKSANSPRRFSPSSSGFCRNANTNGWAIPSPARPMSVSSPRPTGAWRTW
jgi:NtrC-family two-component system response regulator AlgB